MLHKLTSKDNYFNSKGAHAGYAKCTASMSWVVRPDDLVVLKFEFKNLVLDAEKRQLARSSGPASITVIFQSQHVAEKTYPVNAIAAVVPTPSRISGPTRLVFTEPEVFVPIKYTIKGVLEACSQWKLRVAASSDKPSEPTLDETSIELPYRLILSPSSNARWIHASVPYVQNGRTEGWHTILNSDTQVRALYTRDQNFAATDFTNGILFTEAAADAPFFDALGSHASLTADNRGRIIYSSLDVPVTVDRLHLSSFGGTLVARGNWPESPLQPQLASWIHRSMLGRDEEVSAVTFGYYVPFGHRALLLRLTKRTILPDGRSVLKSIVRTVSVEVKRYYPNDVNDPQNAEVRRNNPFRSVEYLQLSSRDLPDDRVNDKILFEENELMSIVVTDSKNNKINTQVPLMFTTTQFSDFQEVTLVLNNYLAFADAIDVSTTHFTKTITFGTMDIKDFPPFAAMMSRAELSLDVVKDLAASKQNTDRTLFSYYPPYLQVGFDENINKGEIIMSLMKDSLMPLIDFSGGADRSGGFLQPSTVVRGLSRKLGIIPGTDPAIPVASLEDGLNQLAAGEFDPSALLGKFKLFGMFPLAQLLPIGNLAQAPSFITRSMSKIERLVHDVQELKEKINEYNPNQLLNAIDPLVQAVGALDVDRIGIILGNVITEMTDIAASVGQDISGPAKVLQLKIQQFLQTVKDVNDVVENLRQLSQGIDLIKDLHVHLTWQPNISLQPSTPDFIKSVFYPNKKNGLLLSVDARMKAHQGTPAGISVFCSLDDFTLMLVNSPTADPSDLSNVPVSLKFEHLQFSSEPQKKPDISVVLGELKFGGVLSFIETLRNLIPLDGFSDPPNLHVDTTGIKAGFSLGLPNIAVGIFSLENISLAAELVVPFLGETPLHFDFSFCSAEHPFLLTVAMLGGGGYFHVQVSPKGIDALEAALEFGASLSINLGVASGSVCIMAGIYFAVKDNGVTLSGFLRIRGEVDVLGLISASIELRMTLEWVINDGQVIGRATIIVEIDIMFFSKSVEVSTERRFAGSNRDPTLEDVMTDSADYKPWTEYCLAFA